MVDAVAFHVVVVFLIQFIGSKFVSVKPEKPAPGGEPQKAFSVLQHIHDGMLQERVVGRVVDKVTGRQGLQFAGYHTEEEYEEEAFFHFTNILN
jgi:hypothetical protein